MLRDKITRQILKYHPIPKGLQDSKYEFYYSDYCHNLYCPMGKGATEAYALGKGAETKPQTKTVNGITYTTPPKMASITSSSAMTFNLLGNDYVGILPNGILPCGAYALEYEKRMHTIAHGNKPAHLDAFLSDEPNKTAIFCEMKFLEWLDKPSDISPTYFTDKYYFKADNMAVNCPKDAFAHFLKWAEVLQKECCKRYDGWQMFKHLLAIYNYTSFVTKDSVNKFDDNRSMASKYNNIILTNVVNEFPAELIEDAKTRTQYEKVLCEEHREARIFAETMKYCEIPALFYNNCNADIGMEYVSVKDFIGLLDIGEKKKEYLDRYCGR